MDLDWLVEHRRQCWVAAVAAEAMTTPHDPVSHVIGSVVLIAIFELTIVWLRRHQ
jgi:Sec-independent protein secretion pathway component TatC